jgi:hypothetical protein
MNVALSHPLRLSGEDQDHHAARIWMPGKMKVSDEEKNESENM